jgi:hypothetical protein
MELRYIPDSDCSLRLANWSTIYVKEFKHAQDKAELVTFYVTCVTNALSLLIGSYILYRLIRSES